MAKLTFLPELGIKIFINPERCLADYIGTRAMLEAEGLVPENGAWPDKLGWSCIHVHAAGRTLYMNLTKVATPACEALYRVHSIQAGPQATRHLLNLNRKKALEIAAVDVDSAERYRTIRAGLAARDCQPFQEFKRALLGQKKRGRKPASTTKGATHV